MDDPSRNDDNSGRIALPPLDMDIIDLTLYSLQLYIFLIYSPMDTDSPRDPAIQDNMNDFENNPFGFNNTYDSPLCVYMTMCLPAIQSL